MEIVCEPDTDERLSEVEVSLLVDSDVVWELPDVELVVMLLVLTEESDDVEPLLELKDDSLDVDRSLV